MTTANRKTQADNVVQSLLFNNPKRVMEYHWQDSENNWRNRADSETPVRRLYVTVQRNGSSAEFSGGTGVSPVL